MDTADLENGIRVLDIGCGKGKAVNLMAKHFPKSIFHGYDLSKDAIDGATNEGQEMNNSNVFSKVHHILDLNLQNGFDLITAFDAIHDQPKPDLVLKNINHSLSGKGVFLMQLILASTPLKDNIFHPLGTFLYTISCMHCMSVSLSQNGAGLGACGEKKKHSLC
jgi:cyclopropane fatty-acyl-phospholipid synthase-like methyltransferase